MKNAGRIKLAAMVAILAALFSLQSASAQEQPSQYVDGKYDFSVTVPATWKSARLQEYSVPGVARVAYARPGGASIVIFVQEPGKAFEPRFLMDESAKSMKKVLDVALEESEVRNVGGKQAMWLIVKGKGTGGAIDGKGSVETSQHWIAVPREKDIVVVLLTSPATDFQKNSESFVEILKTLKIGGNQTQAQSDSK